MDIKELKAIYKFLKDTDIVEFEHEGESGKLRLKRAAAGAPGVQASAPAPVQVVQSAPAPAPVAEPAPKAHPDNVKIITSPMVGTFYRSPSPESPPFVELGSIVKSSQAMCIIEAMKLMNEVESEFNGKVISILVENGQPVEYGEPLFHIEVAK